MSEIKTADGKASAFDATVSIGALEDALAEARLKAAEEAPFRAVWGLEAKVAKLKAHLAGAEAALVEARKAAEAAKGN